MTKTKRSILLLLFGISLFPFTLNLSGEVLGEGLSYFLISLWLYVFALYNKNKSPIVILLLSFISGVALGNKMNNVVISLCSLLLVFFINSLTTKQKIYNFLLNSVSVITGFLISTWYIRGRYESILMQIISVAGGTGGQAAHGSGEGGIFNLKLYLQSILGYWQNNKPLVLVFVSMVMVFIYLIKSKKLKLKEPISVLLYSTIFASIFIAKYPLTYYQFPNAIVIIFIFSYFISKYLNRFMMPLIILLATISLVSIKDHYISLTNSINDSVRISNYQSEHPSKTSTLYDYAPVTDFMYIWMRGWGSDVFDKELRSLRPDILELKSDYGTVYLNSSDKKEVFDVCWDRLYIRESRAKVFLEIYKDKRFDVNPIGDTGIWEIESNHCKIKPEIPQMP